MQKILYYDCFSGISGDMNLGAMIHLGADVEYLKTELEKLKLDDFELDIKEDQRNGISGCNLNVNITKEQHHHKHFSNIRDKIMESELSDFVKENSLKIFTKIAEAEAIIHNTSVEKVHFHEVGAIDSIVDIVGAAICLDYLKVDKIISSTIVLGKGFVKCDHGILPVPAPATLEILKNIPVIKGDIEFEATTPTGAGILAALADEFTDDLKFTTEKVGYGIGNKVGKRPNLLRVVLGTIDSKTDELVEDNEVLECNIDDMNPEHFDLLFDLLFEAGALDVHIIPIIMKKSRPAFKLEVLCSKDKLASLMEIVFKHTTSLGIKNYTVNKYYLHRDFVQVSTPWGEVKCKRSFLNGKLLHEKPEYEECKQIAKANNLRIEEIINYIDANRKI